MSGRPPGIDPRQTRPPSKKWLKRVMARLERREAKRIDQDPDRDQHPKRRFSGWD